MWYWISKAYKIKNIDLLMIRVFASLSIGLALMNFATLGLSEDDATKFLRYIIYTVYNILYIPYSLYLVRLWNRLWKYIFSVRKLQYVNIMTIFLILHYFDYFSPIHTFVVFGTILQFVFILLPKVKSCVNIRTGRILKITVPSI